MLDIRNPFQSFFNTTKHIELFDRMTNWSAFSKDTLGSIADLEETETSISYHIDLPGVKREDLSVVQNGKMLEVKAERKGRVSGKVETSFTIAPNCDTATLDAKLNDGVLTISFMKFKSEKTSAEPKTIRVK